MELRPALPREIPALTALSRAAFDTDVQFGSPDTGGPPDYDSEPWHASMRREGRLYAALANGRLVGGAVLFRDSCAPEVILVGRIFVDSSLHGRGYGLLLMQTLEAAFPQISCWRLDTPVWNARTNRFYPKLGYAEVGRDAESVYYEKKTGRDEHADGAHGDVCLRP